MAQPLSFSDSIVSMRDCSPGVVVWLNQKTYAVYKNGTLVLEDPLNLPDHTRVEVIIRRRFSDFVKKFGEPEAKEDIDQLLLKNRRRVRDA
jgi:predicted DNA-binding antitoxin AbrB/MazE fold protein